MDWKEKGVILNRTIMANWVIYCAILQLRYSDETTHERFESLNGLKRQGIEPTIDHYEVIYVAPLLPYKDRDVMLESLYATFNCVAYSKNT